MKRYVGVFHGCLILACLLGLTEGCAGSKPSRFYLLHSVARGEIPAGQKASRNDISVGIGPVNLPEYLDRPQIITRTSLNRLELAEFDRWAEPLSETFPRVLAENLGAMLGTDRVLVYPWPRSSRVDCQVEVQVNRFEGSPGGSACLSAWWTLYGENGKSVLASRQSELAEPVTSSSYEDLVAAQSRLLGSLSREIAAAITQHL